MTNAPCPMPPAPVSLRPSEIRVLQRHEKLLPSKWAERYRIVRKSSFPGPWRNRVTPYLQGVMDAFGEPTVREIVLCKGVQTGGTEAAYNCLAWWMDRSSSTALVVMADEKSVKRLAKGRLLPMIDESPKLASIKSDNPDDTTIYQIVLKTGASINIGWATSQAAVASEPCEVVVLDEIDKYTSGVNLEEAKRRVTTYPHTSKIFALSTPGLETGPVWNEIQNCDEVRDYHVPCPDCGTMQDMAWGNFKWPVQQELPGAGGQGQGADPREIRRLKLAWYECPHCASRWDDTTRDEAVRQGEWVSRRLVDRPQRIGFMLPAWLSRFVSISHVVAMWLESQHDPARLRMWYNTMAGLPFSQDVQDDSNIEQRLYDRRHQYGPDDCTWHIPAGGLVLTCAVDVQDNRLEAEIVAWGVGCESWGIEDRVFLGSPSKESIWNDLEAWCRREFIHENGHTMRVAGVIIDTGGHHSRESYYFIYDRRHQRMPQYIGCKGSSTHDAPLIRVGQSRQRRSKQALLLVGTNSAKDTISAWLHTEEPGPGYMHFPPHYTFDWFRQLTAEKPVEQKNKWGHGHRVWAKKSNHVRNEALDKRVYSLALVSHLNPDWQRLAEQYAPSELPAAEQKKAPSYTPPRKNYVTNWRNR